MGPEPAMEWRPLRKSSSCLAVSGRSVPWKQGCACGACEGLHRERSARRS